MIDDNNFVEIVEESDERYRCYTLNKAVQIFNCFIKDEALQEVRIYISTNIQLESIISIVKCYINWFTECETALRNYYENELREKVYNNWFNELELYSVDITFNNNEDYGATISCGDQLFQDHSLIIDFDREKIDAIHLNG